VWQYTKSVTMPGNSLHQSLARTAEGLIFYSCSVFFLLLFLMPNLWGHWMDINQTWTHIHLWLLFENFFPNSPGHLPQEMGQNTTFLVPTSNFDWKYLCNGTRCQQLERNLSIYSDSSTCPLNLVNFCPETAENCWGDLPIP